MSVTPYISYSSGSQTLVCVRIRLLGPTPRVFDLEGPGGTQQFEYLTPNLNTK